MMAEAAFAASASEAPLDLSLLALRRALASARLFAASDGIASGRDDEVVGKRGEDEEEGGKERAKEGEAQKTNGQAGNVHVVVVDGKRKNPKRRSPKGKIDFVNGAKEAKRGKK